MPREPKRVGEMTDAKLIDLARKYKKAQQQEAQAKADKETIKTPLIAEMRRRNIKAIESDGVRLNITTQEETVYDMDAMEEHLSPKMFKQLTKRIPDRDAIVAAITAGTLKAKTIAKFATQREKASYPTVTFLGE